MYANGSLAQPFVVIKGYHMGSLWFEEAFNKLRGVSFFFEYEHCLRDLAPAGSHLASAMLTFRHLQQSCGSCTDQQRTTRCRAMMAWYCFSDTRTWKLASTFARSDSPSSSMILRARARVVAA